jgi:hypothetical protein
LAFVAALGIQATGQFARAEIKVATDFEGGSAKVLSVDQVKKVVRIMPGGDPERGWPCWWYLRVDGLHIGDKLTLELVPSGAKILPKGPNQGRPLPPYWSVPLRATFSTDAKTWRHSEPGRLDRGKAIYGVPVEAESIGWPGALPSRRAMPPRW